jgi:uncharacterized membrane protein YhiD involved in acid resistance
MGNGNDSFQFQDIIKNSFLKGYGDSVTLVDGMISLVVAFLLGSFIFFVYRKTFRGVVYNHSFNVTLVLMTMITALVIMTISTNIVLSLGMVGALSIVRFRTALKDPLDIVFMFWSIAGGIAVGAGVILIAAMGSIFIALAVFLLTRYKFTDMSYLLIIHHADDATDNVKIQISKLKHTLRSKTVRMDHTELVLELKTSGQNTGFVNEIMMIDGVKNVSLVSYNGDYAP